MDMVIDATMGCQAGEFTYCPVQWTGPEEFQVVTGLSYLGAPPAGSHLLGVWHPNGKDAVDAFVLTHQAAITGVVRALKKESAADENRG